MTIAVGLRKTGLLHGLGIERRSVAVGCDFPICDKALEFPVDIQSTNRKCMDDTIRYMLAHQGDSTISGWVTNTQQFYCGAHAHIIAKEVKSP